MSEYDEQAQTFLDRFGLRLRATHKGDKCPEWSADDRKGTVRGCQQCGLIHGDRYRVTISRRGDYAGNEGLTPKRIAFDFWNSQKDMQDGSSPTAYDVLACISGDVHCPDSFDEFCDEYGYEKDSRKAEAIYRLVSTFSRRLRTFFNHSEQEALAEIR